MPQFAINPSVTRISGTHKQPASRHERATAQKAATTTWAAFRTALLRALAAGTA